MRGAGRGLTVVGIMVAAFAGGACMQWLMGGGAAQAAAAQQAGAREIRAQRIVLVDAKGAERAVFAVTADGTGCGLAILGESGKQAIGIGVDRETAAIGLYDRDGREHLDFGVKPDGSEAGMGITSVNGKLAISMGYGPTGNGLSLYDSEGRPRAGVGMPPNGGAGFVAKDASGKEVWRAP